MPQSYRLRRWWLVLFAIIALYIALAVGRALTAHPWNDEAWYASPSLSLIKYGNTGTPLLETAGKFWKGIHQRTFWVMPLQFFVQVPWFKIFGFSLLTARLNAIAWGLVALLSWGGIVYGLTKNAAMVATTMALLACDYQFVSQSALGRMDAMALALSSLAILLYITLRTRNLRLAVLLSQSCVVACGLTHPTAGVPAFVALVFLTLYCDRHRIGIVHVLVGVVPYVVGAVFLVWYISPNPQLFRSQFFGNVNDIDRLGGFTHPFRAVWREAGRYAGMAGFAPGLSSLYRIRIITILVYGIAVATLIGDRRTRQEPGVRTLLWLWGVYFACMTFYENTKEVKYAFHIIALYDALVAVWLVSWWNQGSVRRFAATAGVALLAITSVAGLLYTSLVKDDYRHSFLPAAAFLQHSAAPRDLILASSEFGFPLGFDRNIVDDHSLTYDTHKVPDFIVMGDGYRELLDHDRTAWPQAYNYFENLLQRDYQLVYSHGEYQIFERKEKLARSA